MKIATFFFAGSLYKSLSSYDIFSLKEMVDPNKLEQCNSYN
jgi:hypothetical protein